MENPVTLIINAINKASFNDSALEKVTKKALSALESDLNEADYTPSSVSETIFEFLEECLNEDSGITRDEPEIENEENDSDEDDLRDTDDDSEDDENSERDLD